MLLVQRSAVVQSFNVICADVFKSDKLFSSCVGSVLVLKLKHRCKVGNQRFDHLLRIIPFQVFNRAQNQALTIGRQVEIDIVIVWLVCRVKQCVDDLHGWHLLQVRQHMFLLRFQIFNGLKCLQNLRICLQKFVHWKSLLGG